MIRDGGFDVVHTHSSKAGVLGRIVARRAKVPVIVHTSHGLPVTPDMSGAERGLLLAAERRAAGASDRIVAVSHATADELVALRLARPEQIAIIPSGIDVDRFRNLPFREEARRSFGISTDGPVAGWVGRHFPQKRPEVVLEVARRVVRAMPEASFLMVATDRPSRRLSRRRRMSPGSTWSGSATTSRRRTPRWTCWCSRRHGRGCPGRCSRRERPGSPWSRPT